MQSDIQLYKIMYMYLKAYKIISLKIYITVHTFLKCSPPADTFHKKTVSCQRKDLLNENI